MRKRWDGQGLGQVGRRRTGIGGMKKDKDRDKRDKEEEGQVQEGWTGTGEIKRSRDKKDEKEQGHGQEG
jgi:hypothetical protein